MFNSTALQYRRRVVRLNTDGTVDTTFNVTAGVLGYGADGHVNALALAPNGTILIAGDFASYNGVGRAKIARLNADGSLDTGFTPPTVGPNATVSAVAVDSSGQVYLAGSFTAVNGVASSRVARLSSSGALDTGFNTALGTGPNAGVESLAWQGANLVIGGNFSAVNGTSPLHRVARLLPTGAVDSSFTPGTRDYGNATSLSVISAGAHAGKILVVGNLSGGSNYKVLRLLADGGLDSGFNVGTTINSDVAVALGQADGKVLIGGYFTTIGGVSRNNVARLNDNGTLDAAFTPGVGANGAVLAMVLQPDGMLVAGGSFTTYQGVSRNFLTRIFNGPFNQAPLMDAIANVTVAEDSGSADVTITGISPGPASESAQRVTSVTATSSNPAIIPNPSVAYTPGAATATLTFSPVADANGTVTISVVAQDDAGTTAGGVNTFTRTFTITVNPVNDAPTLAAITDPTAILEDAGAQTVNLSGISAGGGESQTLTVTATSGNTALIPNPTVTYTSPGAVGSLSYTPVANAYGSAVITVTVTDDATAGGAARSTVRTFTVNVTSVNDAPTLTTVATLPGATEDTAFTITYATLAAAANAADVEEDTLSFRIEAVSSGTLSKGGTPVTAGSTLLAAGESLVWTPAADANGTLNAFTIKAWDGALASATAVQVRVAVAAVNDAPTLAAITDPTAILEDAGAQTVNLSGIGAGGGESQTLTVTATSDNPALIPHPTVTYTSPNAVGSLSYTPVPNGYGSAVITVTVTDDATAGGAARSTVRTFTVNVTPVNDAPILTAIGVSGTEDTTVTFSAANFTGAYSDVENDSLVSIQVTALPATGTLKLSGVDVTLNQVILLADLGSLTYVPAANENGAKTFTVTASDGTDSSAPATVTMTLAPVNDMPTLTSVTALTGATEDTAFTITYAMLAAAANAADVDGDTLSFRVEAVSSGTLTKGGTPVVPGTTALATGESLVWTPALDANGTLNAFTIKASDGTLASATAVQVQVAVAAVNDAPTLTTVATLAGATEDTAFTISYATLAAAANEADVDGDTLAFRIEAVSSGTLTKGGTPVTAGETTLATGESLVWTPALNDNGTLNAFTIKAWDGALASASAVAVQVAVTAVNDQPTFSLRPANTVANLIANGSFETSDFTGWTAADTANTTPTLAVRANGANLGFFNASASDGSKSVTHGFSGSSAGSISVVQSAPVAVPAGGGATLSFSYRAAWQTFGAAGNRVFRVVVKSADGSTELLTQTILTATPNTFIFQTASTTPTVDLSAYAGQSIRVGFVTDIAAGDAGNGSFQLDNVVLSATTPDFTVYENSGLSTTLTFAQNFFAGAANESDQTVTYLVSAVPSDLFSSGPAIAANGTLTFTPATDANGSAVVTVYAQDSGGTSPGVDTSVAHTFNITVGAVNSAPRITFTTETGTVTVDEDSGAYSADQAAITIGLGDSGQTITSRTTENDNNDLFSSQPSIAADGTLTFTPAANANGSALVTLTVTDDGGTANGGVNQTMRAFTINVTAVNDAPTLAAITDPTAILEDAGAQTVNLSGISAGGGESQTLTVTATSDNTALIPNPTVTYTSPTASGSLSYTPVANAYGSAVITVRVTDDATAGGAARYTEQTFTVVVDPVNDRPTLAAIGVSGTEDTTLNFTAANFTAAYSDVEGTPLVSITVTALPATGTLKLSGVDVTLNQVIVAANLGSLTYVPVANANGAKTFTVTASDGTDSSAAATVTMTLAAVNDAPSFALASTTENLLLNGSFETGDATGWTTAGGAGDIVSSGGAFLHDGTYFFTFNTGDEASGGTLSQTFVTIPGRRYTLQFNYGTDGTVVQALQVEVSDSDLGTQSATPTAVGNYEAFTYSFVASGASSTLHFTDAAANDTTTGNGLLDAVSVTLNALSVAEDSGTFSQAGFATSISRGPADEADQTLTFTLTPTDTTLFSVQPAISAEGTLTFTPAPDKHGSTTVLVALVDSGSGVDPNVNTSASQTFTITITAVNDAPSFTKGPDQLVYPGDGAVSVPWATAISVGPADEGTAGQTLTFAANVTVGGALFSVAPTVSSSGTLAYTPLPGAVGIATVSVTAQDTGGTSPGVDTSAAQTFTITLAPAKVFVSSSPTVAAGQTVSVPVSLATSADLVNGAGFTLTFDAAKLAFSSVTPGSGLTVISSAAQAANGKVGIVVSKAFNETFSAGDTLLATMNFTAAEAPNTTVTIGFSDAVATKEVVGANAVALANVLYVPGQVTITDAVTPGTGPLEGDVSGNGVVTVADAIRIGRIAAGLETLGAGDRGVGSVFQRADCAPLASGNNGDGRITVADWVQALRFANGDGTPESANGPTGLEGASLARASARLSAGSRVVRIAGGNLVAGRANSLTVQLDAQGNEAGVQLSLGFDPAVLTFVSATAGSGASGATVMANAQRASSGRVGLVLVMPTGQSIAAGTRDLITLTFVVAGSGNTTVTVLNDTTASPREVADVNANPVGATYVGGSFNVILPAGLKAAGMERAADGSPRLVIRKSDGTPVTAAQASKYVVHVTSNLGGVWTLLPNALVLEDGALKIVDPAANGAGLRLYKLVETP